MKLFKKATSLLLTSILFLTAGITAFAEDYYDEETEKDIIVYFTNDVHNAYEQTDTAIGYASLAADIKSDQNDESNETILVDAGDSIQGGIIMRCDSDSGKKLIKSMVLRTADRQGMC